MLKRYLALTLMIASSFQVAEALELNLQSNHDSHTIAYRYFVEHVAEPLKIQTDNRLIIKLHPQDARLTHIKGTFRSAKHGIIDGFVMTPQYWGNIDPVFAIISDLPMAWNDPFQFLNWLTQSNGIEFLEKAYEKHNLILIGYTAGIPESLVSKTPLNSLSSFKNKVIRVPAGLTSEFITEVGAITRPIPFNRIKYSLENGDIDMADATDITNNRGMGLYEHGGHTNYPGFHSMPLNDVVLNQEVWAEISPEDKNKLIELLDKWRTSYPKKLLELAEQDKAELKKAGIKVYHWTDEELERARKIAIPIWRKNAKGSYESERMVSSIIEYLGGG